MYLPLYTNLILDCVTFKGLHPRKGRKYACKWKKCHKYRERQSRISMNKESRSKIEDMTRTSKQKTKKRGDLQR